MVTDGASYEQIIGGRYALYGPIASGGMATVHFGRLLGTGGFARTVAIKRVHGEFLETPEIISTLLDEARLASRIRHPNVVATLDMVNAEDELFLVMEYVTGESLSHLLSTAKRAGQTVDPRIATGILCGVLYGLHAAHDATDERGEPLGIVHRDVSPQNILVGTDGLARLLDFGIAKGKGRLQTTRAGQLKGKVGYMAPEQILGEEPDRRSDVYAAAVTLWEALTGQRLFPSGDSAGENFNLIPKILEADINPPTEVAPDVPRALNGIVMRGLNRERDARYDTAHEFAVALEDSIGIATHRQIGEWVKALAKQTLADRATLLQSLEAQTTYSGKSAEAVDTAVKRRRKKRLESLDGSKKYPGPATVREHDDSDDDIATQVGDEHTEVEYGDDDARPSVPRPSSKRTRLGGTMATRLAREIKEAKREKRASDIADLRKTIPMSEPSGDDELEDPQTAVYEPASRASAPPALPVEEPEQALNKELSNTLPSQGEPVKLPSPEPQPPTPTSDPLRTFRSSPASNPVDEDLVVPVSSNKWLLYLVIGLALVAVIAVVVKLAG